MAELRQVLAATLPDGDVRDRAASRLEDLEQQHPVLTRELAASRGAEAFVRTFATSDYMAQTVQRRPDILAQLARELANDSTNPLFSSQACPVPLVSISAEDDASQLQALRAWRHSGLVRILVRANGHLCRVESTLAELSGLADALIREAVRLSRSSLEAAHGTPRGSSEADQLCVLAMGKLGGGELNLSSDVDLILTHAEAGETDGRRALSSSEFFARQGRRLTHLLAHLTPDGFCYRVDTRLRPFGASGQPVVHVAGLEHYLGVHGREWERYAYIKQRPLTGGEGHCRELQDVLRAFTYRRYLDYGVFEDLRAMKALIDAEVTRKELEQDVKRGPGGIRELEFMVQTLQLVFGGKFPALQTPSFFGALSRLRELKLLDRDQADAMYADYCFLRRVENAIQGFRDQQTHELPQSAFDRQRLAWVMQVDSYDTLAEQLASVRQRVQRQFDQLNVDAGPSRTSQRAPAQTFEQLTQDEHLCALRDLSSLRGRLEKVGQQRLDVLMPRLVERLAKMEDAAVVAPRLSALLTGIGRRSAYFSLLNEHPQVLDRVLSICRRSPELARQMAQNPILLDTLADPRGTSVLLDRRGLAQRLDQALQGIADDDEERPLIALREFRRSATFDVAIADLENQLPVMKISDRLTDIAELVLRRALDLARTHLKARFGRPRSEGELDEFARFAIIGYGKLGGIELGYGSDLDLVFLFDDGGAGATDGARSIDNSVYFARLSKRLIQILTVPTRAGQLYEVDMRLRPSGRKGLLVSRLRAYESYQQQQAWTWEHQALTRARAVAGDRDLCQRFEQFRRALLQQPREASALSADVRDMRQKMKASLDKSTADEFDLKQGDGGLVDLEFLVQFLVLAESSHHPGLSLYSDNVRQLEAIERAGLLPASDAEALREAYLALRQRAHERSLAGLPRCVPQQEMTAERALVRRCLAALNLTP